ARSTLFPYTSLFLSSDRNPPCAEPYRRDRKDSGTSSNPSVLTSQRSVRWSILHLQNRLVNPFDPAYVSIGIVTLIRLSVIQYRPNLRWVEPLTRARLITVIIEPIGYVLQRRTFFPLLEHDSDNLSFPLVQDELTIFHSVPIRCTAARIASSPSLHPPTRTCTLSNVDSLLFCNEERQRFHHACKRTHCAKIFRHADQLNILLLEDELVGVIQVNIPRQPVGLRHHHRLNGRISHFFVIVQNFIQFWTLFLHTTHA